VDEQPEKCIVIVTVRGHESERHDLNRRAKAADLSLNNYVRQQLGLPLIDTLLGRDDKRKSGNRIENAIGRLQAGF